MMLLVFAAAMAEDVKRQRQASGGGSPPSHASGEASAPALLPSAAPMPQRGAPRRSVESYAQSRVARRSIEGSNEERSLNLPTFLPDDEPTKPNRAATSLAAPAPAAEEGAEQSLGAGLLSRVVRKRRSYASSPGSALEPIGEKGSTSL